MNAHQPLAAWHLERKFSNTRRHLSRSRHSRARETCRTLPRRRARQSRVGHDAGRHTQLLRGGRCQEPRLAQAPRPAGGESGSGCRDGGSDGRPPGARVGKQAQSTGCRGRTRTLVPARFSRCRRCPRGLPSPFRSFGEPEADDAVGNDDRPPEKNRNVRFDRRAQDERVFLSIPPRVV